MCMCFLDSAQSGQSPRVDLSCIVWAVPRCHPELRHISCSFSFYLAFICQKSRTQTSIEKRTRCTHTPSGVTLPVRFSLQDFGVRYVFSVTRCFGHRVFVARIAFERGQATHLCAAALGKGLQFHVFTTASVYMPILLRGV